jgi:hypothetical protein
MNDHNPDQRQLQSKDCCYIHTRSMRYRPTTKNIRSHEVGISASSGWDWGALPAKRNASPKKSKMQTA